MSKKFHVHASSLVSFLGSEIVLFFGGNKQNSLKLGYPIKPEIVNWSRTRSALVETPPE